jgi:RNA polymerase sigma-70 factor (ECF subfamily)
MGGELRIERDRDDATTTLGDLLYADQATPVSESDWVALVRSIATGDQGSLYALYERTHRLVFTLSVRITKNRETAEELTLDVFHDVWRRAATYDPANGTVLGWIMNQARSRAIDRLRHQQRKKRVTQFPEDGAAEANVAGPEHTFELQQQARLLHDALTVLSPDERQAIQTTFFSGLTYAEAAARLNEPLGTVKTRIRSGLQKLRTALSTEQSHE